MDLETCKNEYAKLIAEGGVNVQPGEMVLINADVTAYDMARRVVKACYDRGAAKVEVRWSDTRLTDMDFRYADEEVLKTVTGWEEEQMKEQAEELPCLIHLLTTDPIGADDAMVAKQSSVRNARLEVLLPYIMKMRNRYKWTAVCIPTQPWADLVFPGEENNLAHLWQDILSTVLVNGDGTAVEKWKAKFQTMWGHMDTLNDLQFKTLHLQSELGTDLTVELHKDIQFACACGPDDDAMVNLPSEELFTSPIAGKAEGTLVASCPLVHENQYVEGLQLTFEEGKVVVVKAEKGEQFFRELTETDEGACMLGEVAIVDRNSPVRALGHLLYHTLYDENAACHVAVGRGFEFVVKDFSEKSPEELADIGINQSGIHCDIMWGTEDATITGTTYDGTTVVILEHGEWCI